MRGKDLLYDLSFIDDDIVQEAVAEEMPECFKKGDKSRKDGARSAVVKKRSRQRLMAAAACLMLAVGVTAAVSQTDLLGILDRRTPETVSNDAEHAQSGMDSGSEADTDQDSLMAGAEDSSENDAALGYVDEDQLADAAGEADQGSALKKAPISGGASYRSSGASESHKENNGAASSGRADSCNSSGQMSGNELQSGAAEGPKKDAPVMGIAPDLSESAPGSDVGASSGSGGDTLNDAATSDTSTGANNGVGGGSSASAVQIISSPELASYLRDLKYSSAISNGSAEYAVVDPADEIVYYVNLTEGFARSTVGQAKLTDAEKTHIKQLLQQAK